ncbi:hypothetical protein B0J17DRAFT_724084 [Rhizoctonia solani]|nr:hypothetical protein B0J17DRAFT_724084 [Rhizoctonia solani]
MAYERNQVRYRPGSSPPEALVPDVLPRNSRSSASTGNCLVSADDDAKIVQLDTYGARNSTQKNENFPEQGIVSDEEDSVVGGSNLGDTLEASDSDETLGNDSDSDDAPEAESLSRGRAAADERAGVMKRHEEKLQELRKTKNKAREEFIRSTKTPNLPVIEDQESDAAPDDAEGEGEDGGRAHQSIGRKRAEKPAKKDAPAKRRRVREVPAEKVVDGRTLRVAADVNAPPAISPSSSTRKAKTPAKGGSSFRRKWKKVDATRAQVRLRTGPSRNFVTVVQ